MKNLGLCALLAAFTWCLIHGAVHATIPSSTVRAVDSGNGATTVFNYGFLVPYQPDGVTPAVTVQTETSVGVYTTLVNGVDYSISGVGNGAGGSVTYPLTGSPLVTGSFLIITRAQQYVQPTAVSNVSFYPHVVEQTSDWNVGQTQQLAQLATQTPLFPPNDTSGFVFPAAANRKNTLFGFDANGAPTLALTSAGLASLPVGIAQGGTGATTATGALSNLGLGGLSTLGGGLQLPANNSFWTVGASNAQISRLPARLFTGAATVNDGTSTTNLDWVGVLATAGKIGGDDLTYSQFGSLTDPTSVPGSLATPLIGGFFAANATNSLTNSTPRGLESLGVNNAPAGQNPTVWSYYHECHEITGTGNCYGDENEVRNIRAAPASGWNPYNLISGAIGLELGCGAGLSASGQFNCTVAQYVAANPMPFNAGISFLPGSVAAISSISPAIQMPEGYALGWYSSGGSGTLQSYIYADISGNMVLSTPSGGEAYTNRGFSVGDGFTLGFGNGALTTWVGGSTASNFILFEANSAEQARINGTGMGIGTTTTEGVGTLNITGAYYSNGVIGVSCTAGTVNVTTEVVTKGIVTHC